jgi:chromosome segregation ATPase
VADRSISRHSSIRISATVLVVGLAGLLAWEGPVAMDRSSRAREVSGLTTQLAASSSRLADLDGTQANLAASLTVINTQNGSLGKTAHSQAARIAALKKRAASIRAQIGAAGG